MEISYKIDNHSYIMSLDLLKECYEYGCNTYWRHRKKDYVIKRMLIGCYFLYDENKNIIYIGKTTVCIRGRILSHCFCEINSYLNDYERNKVLLKRSKAKYFSYSEIDKQMIDFVERGLINKYQPILNEQFIH
jgi:hypothetical protein